MNAARVKAGLQQVKRTFRRILAPGADDVIDSAIAELEDSKRRFDERIRQTHHPGLVPQPWGYRIYPEMPLVFKPSPAIRGLDLWVDLYCTVLWWQEAAMPVEQVIHLRVWDKSDYVYRSEWDSDNVCEQLTAQDRPCDGRVMFRCHFDLANPCQHGPKYHLQVGGGAQGEELCWFPEIMSLPRLACPPVDLILVCQLVAANFYWDKYKDLRHDPTWKGILRETQGHLLIEYHTSCMRALNQGDSLLDVLWNIDSSSTE